jgi:anti-sigma factor RsiW
MCNYSAKLIAWLDHELPENEASDVEQHVQGCAECRSLASSYRDASDLFNAYREEVLASQLRRKMPVTRSLHARAGPATSPTNELAV